MRRAQKVSIRMANTSDIVAKLWNLCNVLRDDGVTYQDYVTELTKRKGTDQLEHYRLTLLQLGRARDERGKAVTFDPVVRAIYVGAQTKLRKPANLKTLTTHIDSLDWFSAREEGLGDLYE